jgi:hypothetical protein
MSEMPHFQHDCDDCVFIGHYADHDLYRCPQMGMPTIVARYGDDGAGYTSGPQIALLWHVWEATPTGWVGRPLARDDVPEPPDASMLGEHRIAERGS